MFEIIQGDCLNVMQGFPSNHFSAIVTDPPYGISFMGKGWDHAVPGSEYWKECLRIAKPGVFLLAMGGTRTCHRLTCAIEDAGWQIRDCIIWLYGSGFPKSHNRFGAEGWGTALKPAYEPIIMAMKPVEGTFRENAAKWGQAGINIDACRVGNDSVEKGNHGRNQSENHSIYEIGLTVSEQKQFSKGRWPANVMFDEEAAAMLDENSRIPASRFFYCAKSSSRERNAGCEELPDKVGGGLNATVAGDSRTGHITIQKNNHPTVKPLSLMKYLITLVCPPTNALVLDPFAGSGSTILAAQQLGISAVGIEKEIEYAEIARARLNVLPTIEERKE